MAGTGPATTASIDSIILLRRLMFYFLDDDALAALCRLRRIRKLLLFGSVDSGSSRPDSDVDFLIDVEPVTSSWFPAGLIQDLESLLGRRVEVVTERGLNHSFVTRSYARPFVCSLE